MTMSATTAYSFGAIAAGLMFAVSASCAFASDTETQGVTPTEVLFGQTLAKSGPAGLYGQQAVGVDAYFRMVNDQGGVNGRKIRFISYDDKYQPSLALPLTRQLVDNDKIFAEVGLSGTNQIRATLIGHEPAMSATRGNSGSEWFRNGGKLIETSTIAGLGTKTRVLSLLACSPEVAPG